MLSDFLVPMPPSKALLKKRPSGTYVYYNQSSFRNKKGQPASVQILIGKIDEKSGLITPNKNYFQLFPAIQPIIVGNSMSYKDKPQKTKRGFRSNNPIEIVKRMNLGVPAVLMAMAKQTGLLSVLQRCFNSKWDSMLAVAFLHCLRWQCDELY